MKLAQSLAFIITGASFVIPFALAGFAIRGHYATHEDGHIYADLEACPSENFGCDCSQQAVAVTSDSDTSVKKMTVDPGLCGMGKLDVTQLPNSSWGLSVNGGDGSSRGICNAVPGSDAPCLLSGVATTIVKLLNCTSDICT